MLRWVEAINTSNGAALPSPCHCRRRSLGNCCRRLLGNCCGLANRTQFSDTRNAVPDAIRSQDVDVARSSPAVRHTKPIPRCHEDLVTCLRQELRYCDTHLVTGIYILHLDQYGSGFCLAGEAAHPVTSTDVRGTPWIKSIFLRPLISNASMSRTKKSICRCRHSSASKMNRLNAQ
uniref:SFRICE_033026 n=1 Tax=Spodoptera frugiperda TaxID=7108 RepID=A0A2H1X2A4_SPOFR